MTDHEKLLREPEATRTIWDLATSIDVCMFVTWDGKRQRARPLSARPDHDAGRLYFLADVDSAMDDQIERFPKVTITFADVRADDYVAITGHAIVTEDRAKIADLWTAADAAWWTGPDDPHIRLITVDPEDAELWKGPNRLAAGAKLLAAAVTGVKLDLGETLEVDRI